VYGSEYVTTDDDKSNDGGLNADEAERRVDERRRHEHREEAQLHEHRELRTHSEVSVHASMLALNLTPLLTGILDNFTP